MQKQIAVFTALETIGVIGWLLLVPVIPALAILVLSLFFVAEHIVSFNVRQGRGVSLNTDNIPLVSLTIVTALETVTWIVWLALGAPLSILAGIVFAAGLIIGHAFELNMVNGFGLDHRFGQRLKDSLNITVLEVIAGTGALLLLNAGLTIPAIIAFFIVIQVEHVVSSRKNIT